MREVESFRSLDGRREAKILHSPAGAFVLEYWWWRRSKKEWRPMSTSPQPYETREDARAAAERFVADVCAPEFDADAVQAGEMPGWAAAVYFCRQKLAGAFEPGGRQ